MSTSSDVALGWLRLQSQQRADLQNNGAITTAEWNGYLSNSYKRLYNMLIAAYGNDYYVAETYQFTTTSSQFYPMPDGTPSFRSSDGSQAPKFYKLMGLDLQYSASPSGWISVRRFEFAERNKFALPNVAVNWNGYSNMRYRPKGNGLFIVPAPSTGQTMQAWFAPAPTNLQFTLACGTTIASPVVTMSDTTGLAAGMSAFSQSVLFPETTVLSVASTSVTLSANALTTKTSAIISFWNDSTTLDGIAGWDEFVIIDSAIKAQIKQENDISGLVLQRNDIVAEIESLAEGRDIGQAQHVSDTLSMNGGYDDGIGGGFNGGMGGGF